MFDFLFDEDFLVLTAEKQGDVELLETTIITGQRQRKHEGDGDDEMSCVSELSDECDWNTVEFQPILAADLAEVVNNMKSDTFYGDLRGMAQGNVLATYFIPESTTSGYADYGPDALEKTYDFVDRSSVTVIGDLGGYGVGEAGDQSIAMIKDGRRRLGRAASFFSRSSRSRPSLDRISPIKSLRKEALNPSDEPLTNDSWHSLDRLTLRVPKPISKAFRWKFHIRKSMRS